MHPETRESYDGIRMCGHGGDYSVLYDFVGMRHEMCHSCWNEEEYVRTGNDTVSILRKWQLRAVNLVCLRCGADVTAQKGCARCFPAR